MCQNRKCEHSSIVASLFWPTLHIYDGKFFRWWLQLQYDLISCVKQVVGLQQIDKRLNWRQGLSIAPSLERAGVYEVGRSPEKFYRSNGQTRNFDIKPT